MTALQEEREREQEAELAQRDDRAGEVPVAEGGVQPQAHVEQEELARAGPAALDDEEQRQREEAADEAERDDRHRLERPRPAEDLERLGGRPPAVAASLDEAEDEQAEAARDQHEADRIEPRLRVLVLRLTDVAKRAEDRDQRHRDVDEERPAPGKVGRQPAAEQRPDRGHAADRGAPDAERDRAVPAPEVRVQDGLRGRQDHRAADALEDAGEDQHRSRLGQAGQDGRDSEHHQADEVQLPAADEVADAPERDQQRGEDQRVDRVDPLGLGGVEVQVPDDRRDGDVHDRRVHDDHRDAQAQHGQPEPAAAAGLVHGRGRGPR